MKSPYQELIDAQDRMIEILKQEITDKDKVIGLQKQIIDVQKTQIEANDKIMQKFTAGIKIVGDSLNAINSK